MQEHHEIVSELKLPTYQPTGLFPKQNEVAIKAALFPHFLIGLELCDERKMVINHNLLKLEPSSLYQIYDEGIPTDQEGFKDSIFTTGYIRWASRDDEGQFEEFTSIQPIITTETSK
ncbi:MAG: hypothetical protein H6658_03290 [Ardenticatenaceae bacterium]|nr:hypothetical protein [Ardenticatenaceae bacterium]